VSAGPRHAPRDATPVVVLAGALGAGKTTLLGRCLADPSFSRTAVVIDEIAELAVDPHLLPASPTLVRRAPCGRWTEALLGLERERDAGAAFERVIVEANGVTTPACVVAALEEDDGLRQRFALEGIVAAVDAARGADAIGADDLGRAQAAGADAVVLTKLDIADPQSVPSLVAALMRLNPYAEILRATAPAFAAPSIWSAASHAPGRDVRRLRFARWRLFASSTEWERVRLLSCFAIVASVRKCRDRVSISSSERSSTSISRLLAPSMAARISFSLMFTARESLFWARWIKNTIRNVTMVVVVLMTSCHESEKWKTGPSRSQPRTSPKAHANASVPPLHTVTDVENRATA